MKLKDCECGGISQAFYNVIDGSEYFVGCTVCDNKTPNCESLIEAVLLWNQTYCCGLPPHEIEAAWNS